MFSLFWGEKKDKFVLCFHFTVVILVTELSLKGLHSHLTHFMAETLQLFKLCNCFTVSKVKINGNKTNIQSSKLESRILS